jgi:adenylate cyclase
VDHVLTGTVRRSGDAYRFNLQLVRASDDVLVWGRQIDISQRSLFTIEDQVTAEVVAALQLQISSTERARLNQPSTQNPDAYDEYLQGRALLANYSDSNLREAMNHFERALQIDQNYGLANAGLAMAAGTFSVRFAYEQRAADWGRRAEEYAARALKRDANLAEAHLALASAAGTLYRNFDWPTVIREAQVALTLNPNLDLAHSTLARAFLHMGLIDLSKAESKRAEDTSGGTNIEVSRVYLYDQLLAGRFDEARQMAETLVKRTDAPVIRQYQGLASFYLGDRERARDLLANVRRPDGMADTRSQASLAGVLAASGRREEAERTVRAVLDSGYMDHDVAYALGAAAAQLGRPADAVKWLWSAAETGFPCYQWVARDSLLDPIRSDAGFQAFVTSLRADYDRARKQYEAVSRVP